ncbi:MAG: DUF3404 domain-containing protein [Bacteriovoracaceae bacterium]|nr:DUF3404 domain-containing protein [Bacteriovoracaceae bacterium]
MKFYSLLFVIALLAAAVVGHYSVYFHEDYQASRSETTTIQEIKFQFLKSHKPIGELELGYYFQSISRADLLRPQDDNSHLKKDSQSQNYFQPTAEQCLKIQKQNIPKNFPSKFWIWEKFRCHLIKELPEDFFERRPFMHPAGKSYAYMAKESQLKEFAPHEWSINHLAYFHISELAKIMEEKGELPSPYSFLADLNKWAQLAIYNNESVILTRKYVFFQQWEIFNPLLGHYFVYDRSQFESFTQNTEFNISQNIPGKRCFYADSQICWNLSLKELLAKRGLRNLISFLLIVVFIIVLVWIILSKLKNEKLEDSKRKLALSVLSHELRTPIASQILNVESLMKKIDLFDEETQSIILDLSSSTHRLQRLIVTSQKYLKTSLTTSLINLNLKWVSSINGYIEGLLDEYDNIKFVGLLNDQPFHIDEYWFPLCLQNLINNAISHGKAPILIKLEIARQGTSRWLDVTVQDAGHSDFDNLEDMVGEFVKSGRSEGLGLGLNIVSKVVKSMGGNLTFKTHPTRFTIQLKEMKETHG